MPHRCVAKNTRRPLAGRPVHRAAGSEPGPSGTPASSGRATPRGSSDSLVVGGVARPEVRRRACESAAAPLSSGSLCDPAPQAPWSARRSRDVSRLPHAALRGAVDHPDGEPAAGTPGRGHLPPVPPGRPRLGVQLDRLGTTRPRAGRQADAPPVPRSGTPGQGRRPRVRGRGPGEPGASSTRRRPTGWGSASARAGPGRTPPRESARSAGRLASSPASNRGRTLAGWLGPPRTSPRTRRPEQEYLGPVGRLAGVAAGRVQGDKAASVSSVRRKSSGSPSASRSPAGKCRKNPRPRGGPARSPPPAAACQPPSSPPLRRRIGCPTAELVSMLTAAGSDIALRRSAYHGSRRLT